MPTQPGNHIAGYRVISQLGSGGMGEVYLVENEQLQRREAMKVISVAGAANADFQQRFSNEARTAASLDHPSIITIHNHGVSDEAPWFTMSYLEGPDLASTRLTPAEVGTVLTQVGDALDYAHRHKVVHRDVKPANIVVTREDDGAIRRAVVLDFGIAKLADSPQLTAVNSIVGTMTYTAPEVIGGQTAGPAADQYSLACTTYQLLAGTAPFTADTATALMMAHVQQPPPQLGSVRPDLAAVGAVLARAMAKNPAERYPDCKTFAAEYNKALAGTAAGVQTTVAPTPPPGTFGAPSGMSAFGPIPSNPNQQMGSGPYSQPFPQAQQGASGPNQPGFGPSPQSGPQYAGAFVSGPQGSPPGTNQFPPQQFGPNQPSGPQPYGMYGPGPQAPKKSRKPLFIGLALAAVVIIAVAATSPLWWPSSDDDSAPPILAAPLVSSAYNTSCMISTSQELYCWGSNDHGQLGDGSESNRSIPAKVAGLKNVTTVNVGGYQSSSYTRTTTCAVADGEAYCWGANLFGQIGDGSTDDRSTPTKVPGLTDVTAIATSWDTTCAVAQGDVYCWGDNSRGEFANGGTSVDSKTPTKVTGIQDVTAFAMDEGTVCAVSAGDLYCWGYNNSGQVGDGTTSSRTSPAKVNGLEDVTVVSIGSGRDDGSPFTNTCAVAAGDAYCWGENVAGQLGDGTTSDRETPQKVAGLEDVTSIAVDVGSVCAVTDGQVKCWGNNLYGQLGTGGTSNVSTPTLVNGVGGVRQVTENYSITCAVTDSKRYCWGANDNGELGQPSVTAEKQTTPVEMKLEG